MVVCPLQINLLTIQNEICLTAVNIFRTEAKLHQLQTNIIQLNAHVEKINSNLGHLRGTKMKIQRLLSILQHTTPYIVFEQTSTQTQTPSTNNRSEPHQRSPPITSNTLPLIHFNRELQSIKVCIKDFRDCLRTTHKTIHKMQTQIQQLERKRGTLKYSLQQHHKIEKETIHLLFQRTTTL